MHLDNANYVDEDDGLGFWAAAIPFLTSMAGTAAQNKAAKSAAKVAAEQRKAAEAKARAVEAQQRSQIQLAILKQQGRPAWLMPVAVGGGALLLIGMVAMMTRKPARRRR